MLPAFHAWYFIPASSFFPSLLSAPVPFSVSGGSLFQPFSPLPFSSSRIRFPALPVPRFPARVFSSFLRKKENVAFSPQISYICRLKLRKECNLLEMSIG
jgi:hypothetical protein